MTRKIRYGGDYNPEQWPKKVWDEDHRLFARAGIDTLTVGVFSWSLTQPAEDSYDFTVLDDILDRAAADDRSVCLATGTAALPPWLAKKYPEVNRTDFEGRRHRYGQRHNFCPSPPARPGHPRHHQPRRAPPSPSARSARPSCAFSRSSAPARPAPRTCGRSNC